MNFKVLLAAGATALAGLLSAPAALAQSADAQACAVCHKAAVESFSKTKHGVKGDAKTPAGKGQDCLSCHTDAAAHLKDPSKKPSVMGKEANVQAKNETCQTCHKGGHLIDWIGSAHDRNDVACTDCHKTHSAKDQVLVKQTQAGVCYDCHKDVRADTMKMSGHPLKTGQMSCSSCHAPHGSASKSQLKEMTVNDTCNTCHADKRGPFLQEHPPVADDCAICHKPHGSNVKPMLESRQPFLCQSCHQGTHGRTFYSADQIINKGDSHAIGTGCTNCHSKVHGSNSSKGRDFFR